MIFLDRYAYVTGADRGLGLTLTKVLLKNGYDVFAGSYLDWHELPELEENYPESLLVLPLDVSDVDSVKDAADKIRNHTDKLDILFNNAGIYYEDASNVLEKLDFGKILEMYQVNALGPLRVISSVIRLLIEGDEKKLVNISSEAGSCGDCWRTSEFGYSMSKSALNKQSAILQNHLKEYEIKVFAIHPGWLRSYMLGELNEEAEVEPMDSAKNIFDLIRDKHDLEGPIYLDYQGNEMEW